MLTWLQFVATTASLKATPKGDYVDTNALADVTILGIQGPISNVSLNGQDVGGVWALDASSNVLSITGLHSLTEKGAWDGEWTLTWA
jgi:alpha-glucosidase